MRIVCLLADNSHEISYLIFFRKLGKKSQKLSPAAVVIDALRVNPLVVCVPISPMFFSYFMVALPFSYKKNDHEIPQSHTADQSPADQPSPL